ncbi:N-acetylglucosamine-6-phosphate deacetylase [Arthrobacter sp. AL08]|uniref:N-acetylglucosamine-6-phosphate deacetylase n=1 Tax=Micrococcaceae TaxID=1268 RepID=UPI00249B9DD7|nr:MULTISPECIES: N-acetylglucosamine-6-phosphate deacetylase [Micrococcaceae]MDI3242118.1 N-acetylglucosamine-6-phosphate deacetylase [Arthrobacter sp. AL05]MDI3277942.1 N-acetylglucosamine-6-phosphate deacetylase [Arthrobacter sp. AL08]MDJ0352463.1 N-acetylglucosamine-6-phosphate deacetylase [Pseudarthrobacter sp. PH31-O2]
MSRPPTCIIHSARLVTGGSSTADAWVAFTGDTVSAVGSGTGWQAFGARAGEITDAAGRPLVPGFIDIHCHGGGGFAFDVETNGHAGPDAIGKALAVHHRHGTTRAVLSLVTARQSDLESRLAAVADAAETNPLVLGAHLEGPFLDNDFRGAHDPALLRSPDAESITRLLAAARGHLRQLTLAPELPGAAAAIRTLVDAGVAVAVGHSSADYATALAAFEAGASILTHAFNGMQGIHHRAPGPVAAATRSPGVTLEIINDGVHVHPEVVRLAFAGAPGRIALITDAMAATGSEDGEYMLGSLAVTVTGGVARLAGNGTGGEGAIAGSTLTLDAALRRAVAEVGIPLEEAVTALTETPARAIGRGHDLGRLAVGYAADAVLLADDLTVDSVFAAGRRLPA